MRKKLLALLLMGSLVCGACANTGGNLSANSGSQESQTDEIRQTESPSAEETVPGESIPIINVESRRLQRLAPDGETLLAEVIWDNMTLEGQGYEKAEETVRRLFYSEEEQMAQTLDSLAEMALDHYETGWFSTAYTDSNSYRIARLDTRILSVAGSAYDYWGGAHGYGNDWGTTIDLQSGAELVLSRLAEDVPGFLDKVMELVLADLGGQAEELFPDYESYVKENLESVNWYLDAAGIEFVFTPYEIGPYAAGNITVCVPYGEVADYLKPEYLVPQGEYIMPVPVGREVSDAEGAYHVLLGSRMVQEYMSEAFLQVNGQEKVLGDVYIRQAYLLHRADDRTFLIFDIDWASDDYETFVYEITSSGAVERGSVWARLDGKNVSQNRLGLIFSIDVLGTYSSQMDYILGEEGDLTPRGDIYRIEHNGEWEGLKVVRELPVTVQGQETVLPVDSRLHVSATNREDTAWFEAVDPSGEAVAGEIHYERREEDYQLYIDGVSEWEYFEMLPYAG